MNFLQPNSLTRPIAGFDWLSILSPAAGLRSGDSVEPMAQGRCLLTLDAGAFAGHTLSAAIEDGDLVVRLGDEDGREVRRLQLSDPVRVEGMAAFASSRSVEIELARADAPSAVRGQATARRTGLSAIA